MSDKQVVLAIFPDEAAADAAVTSLKSWDKANDDIKLNAIGVLVLDTRARSRPTSSAGAASVRAPALASFWPSSSRRACSPEPSVAASSVPSITRVSALGGRTATG